MAVYESDFKDAPAPDPLQLPQTETSADTEEEQSPAGPADEGAQEFPAATIAKEAAEEDADRPADVAMHIDKTTDDGPVQSAPGDNRTIDTNATQRGDRT